MNTILEPGAGRHAVRHSAASIRLAGICGFFLVAGICRAQTPTVVTLNFEGLQDGEFIGNYYNGGFAQLSDPITGLPGANGSGPGPNYGITFGSDSLAVINTTSGGSGNVSGNPSGVTVAVFLTGPGVVMNRATGFSTGFSFYYAATQPGTVTVYDGLNGTGTQLASLSLDVNVTSDNCPVVDNQLIYCNWQQIGVPFTGTARSVNFSGAANYIVFDNITIGATTATAPLVVTTTSLPAGNVGAGYNTPLTATGGTTPYTWTAPGLPNGLTVSNGAITGTPTVAGSFPVTLTVTDSSAPSLSASSQPLTLVINPATLGTPTCAPTGATYAPGAAYSGTCSVTGGTAPYTWTFGSLPGTIGPSTATGPSATISGNLPATPPSSGSYTINVTVTDSAEQSRSTTIIINVGAALGTPTCSSLSATFLPGAAYANTCTVTGGTPPYTWTSSGLPGNVGPATATGSSFPFSGTLPVSGSFPVTVTVRDNTGQSKAVTFTITVSAPTLSAPACTASASGPFAPKAAYSATCKALGGVSPYTWSYTWSSSTQTTTSNPPLPSWLTANTSVAGQTTLSGTVPAPPPASYTVTVKVTDNAAQSNTAVLTINVAAALQLSCSNLNGPLLVAVPYTTTCSATGNAPYTFTIGAGALPAGIARTATATATTISGTPTSSGAYSFTVQVQDSAGQTATQSFNGTISPALSISTFTLTAVPSVANQNTVNLTLSSAPPMKLTGKLCLTFSADSSVASSYQGQEVVFANGTKDPACSSTLNRTLGFTVAAGSAAPVWDGGNSSQFSPGTVAGTITVTLISLVDPSNLSVLPGTAQKTVETIPAGAPTLIGSPTMTASSNTVTVVFDAVTSKRSVTGVTCVFNPSSGQPVTSSVSFTSGSFAGADQTQWFGTPASLPTGGSFSLSVTFSCTNCSALNAVQVTVTN